MISFNKLYKYAATPALVTAFLLLIPLIGMQFSNEAVWTLSDFIIAGTLLFGTGFAYKLLTIKVSHMYQVAVALALGTGLMLIWANLAVGIIGSEDNPINLLYFGMLAVGGIGALMTRFRPKGMMYTLLATACAQTLVAMIALIAGEHLSPVSSVFEILAGNGFFVVLFIISALFFRHTAGLIGDNKIIEE